MRPIKFRIWDGDEMLRASAICFEHNVVSPPYPHVIDEHNDIHNLDEVVLMQYTGFNDPNGREIYDGDILIPEHRALVRDAKIIPCLLYVVYFDREYSGFSTLTYKDKALIATGASSVKHTAMMSLLMGNIYENPELINNESP